MNIVCALFKHKWRRLYKSGKFCYYICERCGREAYQELFTFKERKR